MKIKSIPRKEITPDFENLLLSEDTDNNTASCISKLEIFILQDNISQPVVRIYAKTGFIARTRSNSIKELFKTKLNTINLM